MTLRYPVLALVALLLCSCGASRKAQEDTFYNRRNELRVKTQKKLFSSRTYAFGDFTTGDRGDGVDRKLVPFRGQSAFHFTFRDNRNNSSRVEALYVQAGDLKDKTLPALLTDDGNLRLYYAYLAGGSFSTLKNWELIIKNPTYEGLSSGDQVGLLRSPTDLLEVHAHNRFGSPGSYDNMVYEFRLSGLVVGAVQLNGDQKVWLARDLNEETRFAVAAVIAALLQKP